MAKRPRNKNWPMGWRDVLLLQREHAGRASWECQEELFRQEVENADDIRLSHRLIRKCMGDKKKFCDNVEPGQTPLELPRQPAWLQSTLSRSSCCQASFHVGIRNALPEPLSSLLEDGHAGRSSVQDTEANPHCWSL